MLAYMSFDPGITTGWASFDSDGKFINMGQWNTNGLDKWAINLEKGDVGTIIYEKYIVYRDPRGLQANLLKENPTEQAIGVILLGARRANAKTVAQQAYIKETAAKWAGVDPKSVPHSSSHQLDAYIHGIYYLVKTKIIPIPSIQKQTRKSR